MNGSRENEDREKKDWKNGKDYEERNGSWRTAENKNLNKGEEISQFV